MNRQNLVAYNPAKGAERARLVLDALSEISPIAIEVIPIEAMARADVIQTLTRAKLYIDLGNHPGKDRLPREAAALGCCVLVNRRGSAANDQDIPIPDSYKIDDTEPGYPMRAAEKIADICARFSEHAPNFESYRTRIASEPAIFAAQVEHIFRTAPALGTHPSEADAGAD